MSTAPADRRRRIASDVPDRDAGDLEADPGAPRDVVAALVQQPDHRGADVAAPEQADAHDPRAALVVSVPRHASLPIQAAMRISSS